MRMDSWQVAIVVVITMVSVMALLLSLGFSAYKLLRAQLRQQAEASLAALLIILPIWVFWYGVALVALCTAALVWFITFDWRWTLLCVFLPIAALPWLRRFLQRHRTARIEHQLPEALRLLANALQAGMSLAPALALTAQQLPAPLATELSLIVQRQRTGESMDVAFADFQRRTQSSLIQFFGFIIVMSAKHGGQQAQVLARMAVAIQQQHYAQQRILSLSAQARLQGRVMFFLPLALFFALKFVHQESATVLLTTSAGHIILLVCACLMATGLLITRRILGQFNVDD